jgi:hypothetical protein
MRIQGIDEIGGYRCVSCEGIEHVVAKAITVLWRRLVGIYEVLHRRAAKGAEGMYLMFSVERTANIKGHPLQG